MNRLKPTFWTTIGVVVVVSAAATASTQSAAQQQSAPTFVRVYPDTTPGLVAPILISQVQPVYSATAMRAKVQGEVTLEITIDADGRTRDAMVTKSVEPSLDENAVSAVSRWIFKPGRLNDAPVPIRRTITMQFALH